MSDRTLLMGLSMPALLAAKVGLGPNVIGLSGAGTSSQTAATPIMSGLNVFSTVASNAGALLPNAAASGPVAIQNNGSAPLLVYPALGESINGGTVNTAFSVTNAKSAYFYPLESGWFAILSA